MVDQVTYKHLAEIARITGKPIEEVANERNISPEKLADMKLREEMGTAAGSNIDAADFKYSKVIQMSAGDMTQLFQVMSTNDFVGRSDDIKELAPGVFEKMSSLGYTNLRIQNGRLYADKTDENGNISKVYWTLNPAEEALTGEDGSKLIAEVVVKGNGPELRKHVNKYANEYASNTDVPAGTFTVAYNSVAQNIDAMTDEQKAQLVEDVKQFVTAGASGDAEQQKQAARTILTEIGSPDGWLNPSNGELLNPAIALLAAVAYVDYHTPDELKEAIDFVGELALGFTKGAAMAVMLPVMALTSCSDYYDVDNTSISVKQITENSTLVELMTKMADLLSKILSKETEIAVNTGVNNELVAELTEEVKKLRKELEDVKKYLVIIITNQEQNAETAEKYYQLILTAIGTNTDLLAIVVDEIAKSNETLEMIKTLMEENNADNKAILEAITKCKYGLDQLHQDNEEIKKLIKDIKASLDKLPDGFKTKFAAYFNAIIKGITDNGDKIAALARLLTVIANKLDKLDLSKIEDTLLAILDKIGQNSDKMDDLAKLLTLINDNVNLNGQNILEAVNAANGELAKGFATLIELGKENNNLQRETNKLINVVIELIKKLPGGGADIDAIIQAINENTVAVNNHGNNIEFWLQCIFSLLDAVNNNVVAGNAKNQEYMCKILKAIQDLDADCVAGFTAVIEAIGNKSTQGVDLTKIENTLDAILQAIKDHKVKIIIEDHRAVPGDGVNEGEIDPETQSTIDDLNWLLG